MKKFILLSVCIIVLVMYFANNPTQASDSLQTTKSLQASDSLQKPYEKGYYESEFIWVRESDIPTAILPAIKSNPNMNIMESKMGEVDEYISLGQDVGDAFGEILRITSFHSQRISGMKIGKIIIAVIVWNVMSDDVLRYLVGIIVMIIFSSIIISSWRKNLYQSRIPVEIKIIPWKDCLFTPWRRKKVTKWETYNPKKAMDDNEKYNSIYAGHIIALALGLVIQILCIL